MCSGCCLLFLGGVRSFSSWRATTLRMAKMLLSFMFPAWKIESTFTVTVINKSTKHHQLLEYCLHQGLAKLWPMGEIRSANCFVKKVLLEHKFMPYCLWALLCYSSRVITSKPTGSTSLNYLLPELWIENLCYVQVYTILDITANVSNFHVILTQLFSTVKLSRSNAMCP